jgi:hypothetical protein
MIDNTPTGQLQQPAFERTDGRVVFELGHLLGHGNDGFLNRILRLGIAEFARFEARSAGGRPKASLIPARATLWEKATDFH